MKRKNVCYLAVDLIEEALKKPNKTIVLEERVTKPVCEPGIKGLTATELYNMKENAMDLIITMSQSLTYKEHVDYTNFSNIVLYKNGSKIVRNRR